MSDLPKSRWNGLYRDHRAEPRRVRWDDWPPRDDSDIPMDGDPTILVSAEQLEQMRQAHQPERAGSAVFDRSRAKAEEDARWKRWTEADPDDTDRWAS